MTHRREEGLVERSLGCSPVEQSLRKNFEAQERARSKLPFGIDEDVHGTTSLNVPAARSGDQNTGIHERQLHDPSRHPPRRQANSFAISSHPKGSAPD